MKATPNRIGFNLTALHQVDSTNNYATGLVHAGMAQHGQVVSALAQTAGKGQRNRVWETAAGENITISAIIDPKLELHNAFLLSKTIASAVHKFFAFYAGEEVKIKWPNDIYWNDRKAGGILIENIISGGRWKWAIAGIGLNINQKNFDNLAARAVSLIQITGKKFDLQALIGELCDQLESMYQKMLADPFFIESYYHRHLFRLDEEARFKKENRIFTATVRTVNRNGELVVEHGFEEKFSVGEIEWIL